jgi:plasmid stability protein
MSAISMHNSSPETRGEVRTKAPRKGRTSEAEARGILGAAIQSPGPDEGFFSFIMRRRLELGLTDDDFEALEVSLAKVAATRADSDPLVVE